MRVTISKVLLLLVATFMLIRKSAEDCNGIVTLPLEIGQPSTRVHTGAKTYYENNINPLARRLVQDIPGITLDYARVMAEDALNTEENYEIKYSFFISINKAKLSKFKIKTTTLGHHNVNIEWNILEARVTYTAQKDMTVHDRRRRRWLFAGRRRCTRERWPRGMTKTEITQIQSKLTAEMKKVGQVSAFVQTRTMNIEKGSSSSGKCMAWRHVIKLNITTQCRKRTEKIPKPYP